MPWDPGAGSDSVATATAGAQGDQKLVLAFEPGVGPTVVATATTAVAATVEAAGTAAEELFLDSPLRAECYQAQWSQHQACRTWKYRKKIAAWPNFVY